MEEENYSICLLLCFIDSLKEWDVSRLVLLVWNTQEHLSRHVPYLQSLKLSIEDNVHSCYKSLNMFDKCENADSFNFLNREYLLCYLSFITKPYSLLLYDTFYIVLFKEINQSKK